MTAAAPPVGGRHPLLAAVAVIEEALAGTDVHDPVFLTTGEKEELLVAQQRLIDHLSGRQARTLAVAGDVAEARGARSAAEWLAHRVAVRPARLAGLEKLGRRLAVFPELAEAAATGRVSGEHARAVLESLEALPADIPGHDGLEERAALVAKAQAQLLAECGRFTPPQVRVLGRRILEVVAPEAADEVEARLLEAEERRAVAVIALHVRRVGDGTTWIRVRVPDPSATILTKTLEAYTSPHHRHRLAGAAVTGDPVGDPTGERLTPAQLRGHAFCALLEHLPADGLPSHGGTPVTVIATLDHDTLVAGVGAAVLDTGDRLSVSAVRRLACEHGLLPAVLGGQGEVLDLGRRRRLFTTAQRIAHAIAHPTCQAEGCTVAAAWTEAHHWQSWSSGGMTDRENLVGLCWTHHHKAHDSRYQTTLTPTGTVTFHRRT